MIRKYLAALALAFVFIFGNVSFEPSSGPAAEPASQRQVAAVQSSLFEPTAPRGIQTVIAGQASTFASYAAQIAARLPTISIGSPAYAVESNPDTGCDSPGSWSADPTGSTGWSVSGSKCVATNVVNMRLLQIAAPTVKRGHKYQYSVTITNYSGSGFGRLSLGHSQNGTASNSYQLASSLSAINDNFTTSLGLGAGGSHSVGEGGFVDPGAWRTTCSAGPVSPTDPVVYPGQYGVSHLHQFYGNTGAIDPNSTYATLRAKGMSTCGNLLEPKTPINRSGYWHPAMMDGAGHVVKPDMDNLYYKRWSSTNQASHCLSTPSSLGSCVNVPVGLRMIIDGVQSWRCRDPSGNLRLIGGSSEKAKMYDWLGTCVAGDTIEATIGFNECWDGVNIDSPTHRTHTASGFNNCPDAFPYRIPKIELQIWWAVDANYVAGKWHLSCDEMNGNSASTTTAGLCMHADYVEGWSRSVLTAIETNCWQKNYSCSAGDNGDGTALKSDGITPWTGTFHDFSKHDPFRYVSLSEVGMSKELNANGTYAGEITAVADGKIGIMGVNGFNASVDSISIQEVGVGNKGPVTLIGLNDQPANDNALAANDNLILPISFDLKRANGL